MTKKTTAKLCGVIRDGLKASPQHTADCEWRRLPRGRHQNTGSPVHVCTRPRGVLHIRLERALAALDQLEAVLPLEK